MGLINGTVKLENEHLKWKEMFIYEKEVLKQLFGKLALEIEHVGSTAVEGLQAKPIVDIAVGINNFNSIKNIIEKLLIIVNYQRVEIQSLWKQYKLMMSKKQLWINILFC